LNDERNITLEGRDWPADEDAMRYGPDHKEKTRFKILEAAGRLFRRDGYQASGVDKVMAEAGLTPGGFYAHFGSKQALLTEALTHAGVEMGAHRETLVEGRTGRQWVEAFLAFYLSDDHRDHLEKSCPLAALVSEVSRADRPVKETFEAMVRGLLEKFQANVTGGDPGASEERALAAIALCVGGLGLARSVQDQVLASTILEACRSQAGLILSGGRRRKPQN
jgi:TetR/AcrR family transcriptional regulator, transcriptional repressor for nem operon